MITLNVILTNILQFYDDLYESLPLDLSDHFTISIFSKAAQTAVNKSKVIKTRDARPSNKSALERVLLKVDESCRNGIEQPNEKDLSSVNNLISNATCFELYH